MLGGPRAVTPGFENHEINQFKAECLFVVALPSLKMSVGFKPKAPFGSVPPFSVPQLGLAFLASRCSDAAMHSTSLRHWQDVADQLFRSLPADRIPGAPPRAGPDGT